MYPCCHKWKNILLLLRPNNIVFCVHITFSLSMHLSINTDCFYVLAIVWWTWKSRYFFEILTSIPLAISPEEGLLDYTVVLFLIFWEPPFHSDCANLHPHQQYTWISLLSTSLPTLIIFCLLVSVFCNHSKWHEVISHCDLHLYFLDN